MQEIAEQYSRNLVKGFESEAFLKCGQLAQVLYTAWSKGRSVYLCGNGGSGANAQHLANDFLFGAGMSNNRVGLRVSALTGDTAIFSCIANDLGYEHVFSHQLRVKARKDDVLIALSGSGNSPNIVNALNTGNEIEMVTCSILGFDGGKSKNIAQLTLHFPIHDMQASEDLQMIVGHICMKWLSEKKPLSHSV